MQHLIRIARKVVKGFAHAMATGGVVFGAGVVDVANVDLATIGVVVVASVLYNATREAIKEFADNE